ncbi:MAG: response regulator transcription factor [Firmicutes bacterium]|nr:response regulator transcription factor [Bacillota bacterium]
MEKILIVEDDKKLRSELKVFLDRNGYNAEYLENFNNTIKDALEAKADLILLDINLPNMDGQYICREVRKVSDVPIIMVTSRDNEVDELVSINYGADNYITKPYNAHILLAKMGALLKRTNGNSGSDRIDCRDFILNTSRSLIEKDGVEMELTKNELRILTILAERRNQIVSRDDIMENLWDNADFIDDNTLTVNITRLKNKLEELGLKDLIETRRGQGYILK